MFAQGRRSDNTVRPITQIDVLESASYQGCMDKNTIRSDQPVFRYTVKSRILIGHKLWRF